MSSTARKIDDRNSIGSLPSELLLHIASFILGDTDPRFEGLVECKTPEDAEDEIDHELEQVRRDFCAVSADLRHLALVSRRLVPIAQELLFRAPILYDQSRKWRRSPIVNLARTLLERPDLASFVRTLRINVPSDYATVSTEGPPSTSAEFKGATTVINRLKINGQMKKYWKDELEDFYPRAFCGVILSLVLRLERLHLAPSIKHDSGRELLPVLFGYDAFVRDVDLVQIPGLRNLSHLKLVTEAPFGVPALHLLPNLNSLDNSIEPIYGESALVQSPASTLPNVRYLRLDCRIRKIGLAYNFAHDLRVVTRMFNNLESLSLYGEPHFYDHAVDLYNDGWQDWYEMQMRIKSYTTLLGNLDYIAPRLKRLELPRGFWTLPNILPRGIYNPHADAANDHFEDVFTGEVTDFRAFVALEHLILPKAAIVRKSLKSTTRADPVDTLPRTLKRITVFGADNDLWPWLEDILDSRDSHLTALTQIEFLEGEPLQPKLQTVKSQELRASDLWEKITTSGVDFIYMQ